MPGLRAIAQFSGLDILSSMPHLCFRNPLAMMVCATPNGRHNPRAERVGFMPLLGRAPPEPPCKTLRLKSMGDSYCVCLLRRRTRVPAQQDNRQPDEPHDLAYPKDAHQVTEARDH